SKVMPEINALVYHGYPVQELAEHCSFEEVAWLIWHAELPNARQLGEFQAAEQGQRALSAGTLELLRRCPRQAHPMDVLRTAVSYLGMEDIEPEKQDAATNLQRSIRLLAVIPSLVAGFSRLRQGLDVIAPRMDLSFAANFFHMSFGTVPAPEVVKAF